MASPETSNALAIFGGTFDPPHKAHFGVVQQVCQLVGIRDIKIIPCHIPPLKLAPTTVPGHRVNMLQLAIENNNNLSIDYRELHNDSPSYTLNTLRQLKAEHPDTTLYFVIGADNLMSLTQWYQWQDILTLCHLLVCRRTNEKSHDKYEINDLSDDVKKHITKEVEHCKKRESGFIYLAETDINLISSTQLREMLKHNKDVSEWIEPAVYDYIKYHGLYQDVSNTC